MAHELEGVKAGQHRSAENNRFNIHFSPHHFSSSAFQAGDMLSTSDPKAQLASASQIAAYRILERHALRIVLGEPGVGGILAGGDLQVFDAADLFRGVDVDPYGHA